jgi:hypothetical protein
VVEGPEVGLLVAIDDQRHDDNDDLAALHSRGHVGCRGQPSFSDDVGEKPVEVGFVGKRLEALVDQIDRGGGDVGADHSMPGSSELHRQREPDLAQSDDGDVHDSSRNGRRGTRAWHSATSTKRYRSHTVTSITPSRQ